jgi:hypothetical protein
MSGPASASERGYTFKLYGLRWYEVRKLLVAPAAPLKPPERVMLLAMWQCEGRDNGLVFAALATLGKMAGMSERRARETIARLVSRKLVTVERSGGGVHRPNMYSVRWDLLAKHARPENTVDSDTVENAPLHSYSPPQGVERVSEFVGIGCEGAGGTAERVSALVSNPGGSCLKGYLSASETQPESSPDHGLDHGEDHEVITVGLPTASRSQAVDEMTAMIEAQAARLPEPLARKARDEARRWREHPDETAYTRNRLRAIAATAGVPYLDTGFPEVQDLELAAAGGQSS